MHQIDRISDFLTNSGRNGFLAVELRMGIGRARKAHIIPWEEIKSRFHDKDSVKYTVAEIQSYPEIERKGEHYIIDPVRWTRETRTID